MTTRDQAIIAEVTKAEEARVAAMKSADAAALNAIFADEYVYVHGSGRIENKAQYVASISAKTFRTVDVARNDVTVSTYGNTAVMSGEVATTREEKGEQRILKFRFVAVWAKGPSGWQVAFWQNTKF